MRDFRFLNFFPARDSSANYFILCRKINYSVNHEKNRDFCQMSAEISGEFQKSRISAIGLGGWDDIKSVMK